MWHRITALSVVTTSLVLYGSRWGGEGVVRAGLFLVLPLAAVLFPDAIARVASDTNLYGSINRASPPGCICALGWLLLVMPLVRLFVSS